MKRYEIEPRPAELSGGVRLKLFDEDGQEAGGGVFPASAEETERPTPTPLRKGRHGWRDNHLLSQQDEFQLRSTLALSEQTSRGPLLLLDGEASLRPIGVT